MHALSSNIKHLRAQRSLSQQALADKLSISRGRLAKYEEGANEPPIDILKRFSAYFGLSLDLLITANISTIDPQKLVNMDNNRLLLPVTVGEDGNEKIEIVSEKASAGYTSGYGDPEFIASLQSMSLPFLRVGIFRAFPIKGDSMLPIKPGSMIIGKFIEDIKDIKDGKTYIVVCKNEGLVYKRLYWDENELVLSSDNPIYDPYKLDLNEIIELWEFTMLMSNEDDKEQGNYENNVINILKNIKDDINELKNL